MFKFVHFDNQYTPTPMRCKICDQYLNLLNEYEYRISENALKREISKNVQYRPANKKSSKLKIEHKIVILNRNQDSNEVNDDTIEQNDHLEHKIVILNRNQDSNEANDETIEQKDHLEHKIVILNRNQDSNEANDETIEQNDHLEHKIVMLNRNQDSNEVNDETLEQKDHLEHKIVTENRNQDSNEVTNDLSTTYKNLLINMTIDIDDYCILSSSESI
jgi:hypothetical protein